MRRALSGLVLAACAASPGGAATAPPATPPAPAATPPPVRIDEAKYGLLAISAPPGSDCEVLLHATPGRLGDGPASRFAVRADATGRARLEHEAPPIPRQNAWYELTCGDQRARADVAIELRRLDPASFTVRVFAADPPGDVRPDPSLVPLRDAAVRHIAADLPAKWASATRGLGRLSLVGERADVPVRIVAARSTSLHVTAPDGTQEIRVYVADPATGDRGLENILATLLHELGHIWCCSGPGTRDGHWAVPARDPELEGVDRFGLMNHPVECTAFGRIVSCPDRFSRRELEAFGFTGIPAPAPDPCLSRARPLETRLSELAGDIKAREASLVEQAAAIRAMEAQYPRGMPPAAYEDYQRRIARYNADVRTNNEQIAAYNALVTQRNGLPC